jgi:thioesterase domain-containing protein/acyl carrier protein
MLWMQVEFPLTETDKVLQKTPFSFDASVWEFYAPLLVGAQLVIARPGGHQDSAYLTQVIASQEVTRVQLVPSLLQMLLEQEEFNTCKSLKQVFCGGEALTVTLKERLFAQLCADLYNFYGPTEACIDATFWSCKRGISQQVVPIGRPIANTQIYILDSNLQPVPIGVPGELHITGAGLARGYLNRPKLTTEKFIPNPFGRGRGAGGQGSRGDQQDQSSNSERLYKTGDLARYLQSGNIEYLGRIDNQVKIRGFRIELGEIEALLCQHPQIHSVVVIARIDTPGTQRLVAYIVPQNNSAPTISELRHFLQAKLPEYMVPSAFVTLESLPLTPNGKIDRRALPAFSHSSDLDTFVAPRNQLELQLTQLWSKILKVDKVGVQDNFFELGGHSLLTPYLMAQIKEQFGKDISLTTLFQNPTIEQLATIVQADSDSSIWSPLVAIQPHGSQPPLFCLPGAGGVPFYLYDLARCLGSDQPFYSFQENRLSRGLAALTQVEDIAAQYIQALQVVQPLGPYFLAGHSFGGKVAFEMAQQLLRKGHSVALVAILDTTAPFDQEKPTGFNWDNAKWLMHLADSIEVAYAKNLGISDDTLQSLVWEEQLKYVLERLKNADILPPDDEVTQLNNLVQVFKNNSLINYVPQQVYPTRITLLRSSEASVEEPTSELPSEILQDSAWGWGKFSTQPVDIYYVPGNHITMMTQPHVEVLAERLRACIELAQANI